MIEITGIRHAWPERAGFVIDRPAGHPHYTFLHFCSSVEILAGGLRQTAPPHACILYAPGTPQFFSSAGPLLHDWFHFTGDLPKGLFDCDTLHMADTGFFITALVREMEAEYAAGRLHSQLMLDIQVKELLIRLCRSEAGGPRACAVQRSGRAPAPAASTDAHPSFRAMAGRADGKGGAPQPIPLF